MIDAIEWNQSSNESNAYFETNFEKLIECNVAVVVDV